MPTKCNYKELLVVLERSELADDEKDVLMDELAKAFDSMSR